MPVKYLTGFGNSFETEALAGALPVGRNSPQKVNYGLYAEQLSGSPFTAPQATNQRTWLYRIRPTVRHTGRFHKVDPGFIRTAPAHDLVQPHDRFDRHAASFSQPARGSLIRLNAGLSFPLGGKIRQSCRSARAFCGSSGSPSFRSWR